MAMSNETMNLTERDDSNFFIRFVKYFIPWKGDKSSEVVRKIVFMCSIVLFSMSINQLKNYLVPSEEAKSYTKDVVEQYESDVLPACVGIHADIVDVQDAVRNHRRRGRRRLDLAEGIAEQAVALFRHIDRTGIVRIHAGKVASRIFRGPGKEDVGTDPGVDFQNLGKKAENGFGIVGIGSADIHDVILFSLENNHKIITKRRRLDNTCQRQKKGYNEKS